jgi:O-antigen/teichoic acid export membrane protein
MPSAVVFFIGDGRHSARTIARLVTGHAIRQVTILSAVQLVVLTALFRDREQVGWILVALAAVLLPCMILFEYAIAFLQGGNHIIAFHSLRPLPVILHALFLGTAVVVGVGLSVVGVVVAWSIAVGLSAVLAIAVSWMRLTGSRGHDPALLAEMRRFGRHALIGAVSPLEGLRIDHAFAGLVLSPLAFGMYVSASAFTGLTRLISQSVGVVAFPDVVREYRGRGQAAARARALRFVILTALLASTVAAAVAVAAPWLVTLVYGPAFDGAITPTQILIVAGVLLAVRRVGGDGARGVGRASANSWAEGMSLGALVVAYVLVSNTGSPRDAALAVLCAAFVGLLTLAWILKRPLG